MKLRFKHSLLTFTLVGFALLWAGTVSASPFLMSPNMHSQAMDCQVATPSPTTCPMNLVEQIDEWSSDAFFSFSLPLLLTAFLFTTSLVLTMVLIRFVHHLLGPPGFSRLSWIAEQWALSQGILNPKLFYPAHA